MGIAVHEDSSSPRVNLQVSGIEQDRLRVESEEINSLLTRILREMVKMNMHLSFLSGKEVDNFEVEV